MEFSSSSAPLMRKIIKYGKNLAKTEEKILLNLLYIHFFMALPKSWVSGIRSINKKNCTIEFLFDKILKPPVDFSPLGLPKLNFF